MSQGIRFNVKVCKSGSLFPNWVLLLSSSTGGLFCVAQSAVTLHSLDAGHVVLFSLSCSQQINALAGSVQPTSQCPGVHCMCPLQALSPQIRRSDVPSDFWQEGVINVLHSRCLGFKKRSKLRFRLKLA